MAGRFGSNVMELPKYTILPYHVCMCVVGFLTDLNQSDKFIYVWGPTFNVTIRKT